jgi:hypothetical protein
MTVVQYEAPQPLPPSRPGDELATGPIGDVARLRAAAEYAGYIAGTEFVPEALRGKPDAIAAAMLAGAEVGLKPMASLRMVAVIKGRPTLTAEAQRGLVSGAGHELWFEESTITRAIAAGRRRGEDRIGRVVWTMDDAKRAGIAGQANWQRYPAEMLRARASAALARSMFADVTLGIPAVEELEDEPDNGAIPVAVVLPGDAPPAPKRQPRRRTPAVPAQTPATGPAPADEPTAGPGADAPAPATTPDPAPARLPVAPTPPPDEQPQPPAEPLATDAYKRRIFASMRDLGLAAGLAEDAARELRLGYVSEVVGRPIQSSNELTIGEASKVIERLDADKAKRAAGERAFLDELIETFDARVVDDGAAGSAQGTAGEPADAPAAPEPVAANAAGREPDEPGSEPVPYNEFPEGF